MRHVVLKNTAPSFNDLAVKRCICRSIKHIAAVIPVSVGIQIFLSLDDLELRHIRLHVEALEHLFVVLLQDLWHMDLIVGIPRCLLVQLLLLVPLVISLFVCVNCRQDLIVGHHLRHKIGLKSGDRLGRAVLEALVLVDTHQRAIVLLHRLLE